jgi:nicotinate-nucleotide adenylyltransferase
VASLAPGKKHSAKSASKEKGSKSRKREGAAAEKPARPAHTRLPFVAPGMRIGILGGSFNPPHQGHLDISLIALKRLGLDQVWWLVSRPNPLKDSKGVPSRKKRVAAAKEIARHPRIAVTGFDGSRRSAFTIDILAELTQRFPDVHFVWLMGADNLADFHRWRAWQQLFELTPIVVFDRPGFRHKAMAGKAAQRYARFRKDESDARGIPVMEAPAWTLLGHPLSHLSSTDLRTAERDRKKGAKARA